MVGAHVANHNAGTIGVALLGHLVNQDTTPAARAALEWLLAWAAERHDVNPLGSGLYVNPVTGLQKENPNITGHRDWAATACPGGTFYATMDHLRQSVAARITGEDPPPPLPPPSAGPTVPQGLTATAKSNFVIDLSWQASTSSGPGTIRYRVFRNGSAIGTQQTALTYTDQRNKANTFQYQVRAIDAAGNKSALSPPITVSSVQNADGTSGPTVPQGLTATAKSNFVIDLSWQASTSSVPGTIRYRVFRNGSAIGTQQTALTYTDQRNKANTFQYQVRAIDAAGNKSALSPPITVSSVQNADGTSGPTVPQGLTATAKSNFVIDLSWQASTSSVPGTIRYRVFRNGNAIGTRQTALTYTDQRKKANTFQYQVRAIDAAGNKSALSPPITISSVQNAP